MNIDFTLNQMFNSLYDILPKSPELWDESDILTWLKFIKMDQYFINFQENSVDGLIILDLNEEELKEELKITLKLHLKKISKAIDILKNYSKYIKEIKQTQNINNVVGSNIQINNLNNIQNLQNNEQKAINNNNIIWEKEENVNSGVDNKKIKNIEIDKIDGDDNIHNININSENKDDEKHMVIKSIEVPYVNKYDIFKDGSKIGRHSSNKIVIFDESVSRYHAIIEFLNNNFKLKDIGSTTGTFLKIIDPIVLMIDMIIEIGSYQFLIQEINTDSHNKEDNFIILNIYESPEERESEIFKLTNGSTIGRKNSNTFFFLNDMHMSNIHCKINWIGDKFYFEDCASLNGSWLRLSKEGEISDHVSLALDTIFKIGNSAMYQIEEIKLVNHDNKDIKSEEIKKKNVKNNKCCICKINEKDCFIEPCKHLSTCIDCTKNLNKCPICSLKIEQYEKIFKC